MIYLQRLYLNLLMLVIILSSCSDIKEAPKNNTILPNTHESIESIDRLTNTNEKISPIYISTDYGVSWIDNSQGLPYNIQVTFIEKYENEIVLASNNMGIFISSNNRTTWTNIGSQLPSNKINALYVYENKIFAGVYQHGVYSSIDKGANWKSITFKLPDLRVQTIQMVDNQLFVGTDSGIFKLNKQETKWVNVLDNLQILSLCVYKNKLVAGTNQGSLLSMDNGQNWNFIHKKEAVHYTHMIGSRIIEMYLSGDLFISEDWGKSWYEADYWPREGSYVYEVIENGKYYILSNNYGIHRSSDNGKTWNNIYKNEKFVFFDFLVFENILYGGTRYWDEYRGR